MLKTLRIRDVAILEDVTVEFGPGLNLLTGETGAGKSIVVDALGLVAGDRAESSLVRSGCERAVVEGVFRLPAASPVRTLLSGRGVDVEGEDLVVRREVSAGGGGGRVFLNGSPGTVSSLRAAGDLLVELHGQHEHQSLLSAERHRDLLDAFGNHAEILARVAQAHATLVGAQRCVEELNDRRVDRERRTRELEEIVREIDAVGPRSHEYDALESERRLLRSAARAAELIEGIVESLHEGDPTAASMASVAARLVAELAELDPSLAEIARRVDSARMELEDAGAAMRDYRDRAQFDPARLDEVEARRAALDRLRLRYGADEEAVLRAREEAARELEGIEHLDAGLRRAEEAVGEAVAAYVREGAELSRARKRAARKLCPAVEAELAELALPRARLRVSFGQARGTRLRCDGADVTVHPQGAESVELLLTSNPGEEPRPLAKVASGGELSRVMLALHAVLEGAGEGRVLVFDEVDAGIGGAVADAVGARLARLACGSQVLCVTHLPQVAAHADRHYHVQKRVERGRTRAVVSPLADGERVDELARMLGGRKVTAASRRNALELLEAAAGGGTSAARRKP